MLKKLKFVNPTLNLENKIAIVSNSPENLNNENGKLIDSYDIVVRFNFSTIKGFEKNIGTKTDLLVSNHYHFDYLLNENIKLNDKKYLVIDTLKKFNSRKFLNNNNNFFFDYNNIIYLRYKYGLFTNILDKRKINGSWLNLVYPKDFTTGLTFILICLESGIYPDLFGFKNGVLNQKGYYFTKPKKDLGTGKGHNSLIESLLLKRLKKQFNLKVF